MIPARNALSSVENAIGRIRHDENGVVAQVRAATEDAARLRAEQAEAFKALARSRIDSLRQGEVIGRIDRTERSILDILDRQKKKLGTLSLRHDELTRKIEAIETGRVNKVETVEKAVKAIDKLDQRIEAALADDAEWLAQKQKADRAAEIAQAADEKAKLAESDLEKKGEPYRDDALFMYLWKCGYGTSRYTSGGLTKYLDGKIAHLIGFEAARRDFHMLNEIPKRLREHAEDVEQAAQAELEALEAIERRELEKNGVVDLEKTLAREHGLLSEAEKELTEFRAELERLSTEQEATLDARNDAEYGQAMDALTDMLGREDLRALWREASATSTSEDDAIVRQLESLQGKLSDLENQIAEMRENASKLAARRAELERSRDRFYRSGYDDPTGGFDNGDLIGEVIGGILTGAVQGGVLDELFDKGFKRRPRSRGGSIGGGIRMPKGSSRGPWTGGGSIGGGRSRKSSGGFRTGGGF